LSKFKIYRNFQNANFFIKFVKIVKICVTQQVVAENTPWEGGYIGLNSFGFGGSNAHLIMRSPTIPRASIDSHALSYPYILAYSARTQTGLQKVFERLKSERFDPYMMKLLAQTANVSPRRNPYRAYAILASPNPDKLDMVVRVRFD